MSQLEVQILHQDYLLTCPDGQEAQLLEAVERVDQQFQKMRDTGKLRSRERIGVLLAVNLAYENLELRNQLQALQQQVAHNSNPVDAEQIELDVERLAALEAQAAVDQQAAAALAQRLDEVLAGQHPSTDTSADDEGQEEDKPLLAHDGSVNTAEQPTETEVPTDLEPAAPEASYVVSNTDSENHQDVSLATASSESL